MIRNFLPSFGLSRNQSKSSRRELLPKQHCTKYVPRTGTFAYLEGCARCNALEEHHKPEPILTPRFRHAREQPYWLIRDVASDAGWSLSSRLSVLKDACQCLQLLHESGRAYGNALRATAVLVGQDGSGGLRRPVPMSTKMDPFDTNHENRCKEDMARIGKLAQLIIGEKTLLENQSLQALISQLASEEPQDRPNAESVVDWVDSVLQELGGPPKEPPKFASSRHPFYGYIDMITKDNLQQDDLEGYDSDDSFYPEAAKSVDEGASVNGEDDDSASLSASQAEEVEGQDRPRRGSFSKLNLFLKSNPPSQKETVSGSKRPRSASDDGMASPDSASSDQTSKFSGLIAGTPTTKRLSGKNYRPLSTATRDTFKNSYNQKQSRKLSLVVPTPNEVASRFDRQERLTQEEAGALISRAEQVLRREANVLEINDSNAVQVFGDIHGQYFDLRAALQDSGYSLEDDDEPSRTLIFLGDYVDRGAWSCEVLLFVLALKVARPSRVFLLRGNHECGAVVSFFGFKDEIETKYGVSLFHRCIVCFQAMPLCAIVSTAETKWMLCHGGISPKLNDMQDVKDVNRFAEPGMNGLFCDLLWADPVQEKDEIGEAVEFISNPSRGCSVRFGKEAVLRFLENNGLDGLIRAHEVMEDGVSFQYGKKVVTVFSAPNYCGRYGNKAAYLMITHEGSDPLQAFRFDPAPNQPEPAMFESVSIETISGIAVNLPFMPTTLNGFVNRALQLWSAAAVKEAQEELLLRRSSSSSVIGKNELSTLNEIRRVNQNEEDDDSDDSLDSDEDDEDEEHGKKAIMPFNTGSEETTTKIENVNNNSLLNILNENNILEEARQERVGTAKDSIDLSDDVLVAEQLPAIPIVKKKISPFQKAKRKLSRAIKKLTLVNASRFQTAKYSDQINEAHPSLTQLKIQSAELQLRMRNAKYDHPEQAGDDDIPSSEKTEAGETEMERAVTPTEQYVTHDEGDKQEKKNDQPFHTLVRSSSLDNVLFSNLTSSEEKKVTDTSSVVVPRAIEALSLDLPQQVLEETVLHLREKEEQQDSSIQLAKGKTEVQVVVNETENESQKSTTVDQGKGENISEECKTDEKGFLSVSFPGKESFDITKREEKFFTLGKDTGFGSMRSPRGAFTGHSSFSEQELRNLQLLFMLVDRSDDGQISPEEIVAWSLDEGERVSEEDARRVVEAVDADKDGFIGLDDWLWFSHCCREVWEEESIAIDSSKLTTNPNEEEDEEVSRIF